MNETPPVSSVPSAGSVSWLTPHRLCALSDGIFAFAMTLLVVTINFPPLDLFPAGLHQFLIACLQDFLNYGLSFLLLGVFWAIHHTQFHWIRRIDNISL